MEVICDRCNARLNIPDEKLPKEQRVTVPCPKCGTRLTLDTRTRTEKAPGPHTPPPPEESKTEEAARPAPPEPEQEDEFSYDEEDTTLEHFEEGSLLALVMAKDDTQAEAIRLALEGLDYHHVQAESTGSAIAKMRFHHFDLIILADGFDGTSMEKNPILNYLNHQSMSVRRTIFLALVGPGFKSRDNMMAYAMSANLVINEKEVDRSSGMLKTAIADNEKFYKVFIDALVAGGKA